MDLNAKIYIAGHRGLVGSALVRRLQEQGYHNLILRTRAELDLTDQLATQAFFSTEQPDYVFLAAAKVGGIHANNTYPADFIQVNLAIQTNVIREAYLNQVKRMIFLGSSCIYPRNCPQPIKEEYLLTGELEMTNRAYAIAKIAGIETCRAYNKQFGTQYLSAMPTNLYGPNDNYDLENSHVLPALIRKIHTAKQENSPEVVMWGTGTPLREFLYVDDMADACIFLAQLAPTTFQALLDDPVSPGLINVGFGEDLSIENLTLEVIRAIGYTGKIVKDASKPDGTPKKLMDSSRLRNLGWQPKVSLEAGIQQAYAAYLNDYSEKES